MLPLPGPCYLKRNYRVILIRAYFNKTAGIFDHPGCFDAGIADHQLYLSGQTNITDHQVDFPLLFLKGKFLLTRNGMIDGNSFIVFRIIENTGDKACFFFQFGFVFESHPILAESSNAGK